MSGTRVSCPDCQQLIRAEDVNVGTDVAYCAPCGQGFQLSRLLGVEAASVGVPTDTAFDINAVPKGAWYREEFDSWQVGASLRSWGAIFIVPFTCVWAGGAMGGIYGTQIYNGEFDLFMSLFGIPFLLGSIFLVSVSLLAVAGKQVFTVCGDEGNLFVGVGPIGWTRRFDWSEVTSIEEEAYLGSNMPGQRKIVLQGPNERLRTFTAPRENRAYFVFQTLRYKLANRRESRR